MRRKNNNENESKEMELSILDAHHYHDHYEQAMDKIGTDENFHQWNFYAFGQIAGKFFNLIVQRTKSPNRKKKQKSFINMEISILNEC